MLKYMDDEKQCKSPLIKIKLFTAPAAARCSGCKLLYSCFSLRNLEHVGFSFATVQAFGSNVEAVLNPSEVKEIQQSRFKGLFRFWCFFFFPI